MLISAALTVPLSQHLQAGGVIAYPTETVWGLGADIRFNESVAKVYEIKGRPAECATSILVSGIEMARRYAELPPDVEQLLRIFWPGPLTMVLPAKDSVPVSVQGEDGSVGLRCSSHPFVYQLMMDHGHAITTTSANLSGQPPASDMSDLVWLPESVKVAHWEQGASAVSQPSTVLRRLADEHCYQVIRHGQLNVSELVRLAGIAELPLQMV